MAIDHAKMTTKAVEHGLGFAHDVGSGPARHGKHRNQEHATNLGAHERLKARGAKRKTTAETGFYPVPPKPKTGRRG